MAALNGFLLIISNEFAKEFCLPGDRLTLVSKLIKEIPEMELSDLEDFLSLMEIGVVEAITELRRRKENAVTVRPILKLVIPDRED